jgi:predicted DNA-binding transcriptional regulator YafY
MTMTTSEMQQIQSALRDPDQWVVRLTYEDKSGSITERVVSPIRWIDAKTMLALCLCRENPRRFDLSRCSEVQLLPAHDVLMPVPLRIVGQNTRAAAV